MIKITARSEGFRRCGIAHSTTPVLYPDDRFTFDELEMLKAEPMLTVHYVENEVTSEAGAKETQSDEDSIEDLEARAWLAEQNMTYLKTTLDNIEVAYPPKAKKAELIDLIMENTGRPPEDV